MKLKKTNAVLALLSTVALLVHMGYNIYAFLSFTYNPTLKTWTALPFIFFVCAHAVLGMCAVFLQGEGTSSLYAKQNRGTYVQRITAALIFPLLIIHLKNFNLLKNSAEKGNWFFFGLLIVLQLAFFAVVVAHAKVSVSRALITLGLLKDRTKQKRIDLAVGILFTIVLGISAVTVVRGELLMFLPK